MDNKTLFYIAAALGTGYAACYVLKAAPAVKAFEITAKAFGEYIKEYPDTRHVFDKTTQKGMGVSNQIGAKNAARVLGALRAISASQDLRPKTFKVFKSYGVNLHGNGRDGYEYDNAKRWDALTFAAGGGTKTGLPYNLAD